MQSAVGSTRMRTTHRYLERLKMSAALPGTINSHREVLTEHIGILRTRMRLLLNGE